jgi:hypothetical protein
MMVFDMKGKWTATLMKDKGTDLDKSKPKWHSEDGEDIDDLKARMRGEGVTVDNYEFVDPIIEQIDTNLDSDVLTAEEVSFLKRFVAAMRQ